MYINKPNTYENKRNAQRQRTISNSDKNSHSLASAVFLCVNQIPRGKVASYGDVARLAGSPRSARQVGRVLSQLPTGTKIPWHRVINARGELSFPKNSLKYKEQKQRLESEGVSFNNHKIPLRHFRWRGL
ncbi:MAG: MGMT family protein [Cellvibrionaceae bacterium]|nr:MGMT family protein [Cellvibrionaceae bacterium]